MLEMIQKHQLILLFLHSVSYQTHVSKHEVQSDIRHIMNILTLASLKVGISALSDRFLLAAVP